MNAECSGSRLVPFPLSRRQRWVVHAVLLDHVELASTAGTEASELACELGILAAIEDGDSAFTVGELDRIRHEVSTYSRAFDTPERDRGAAESLLVRLDGVLKLPPA